MKDRLCALQYKVKGDGIKVNFMPTEEDLKAMEDYAVEVAQM